jgi:hypothetical protein
MIKIETTFLPKPFNLNQNLFFDEFRGVNNTSVKQKRIQDDTLMFSCWRTGIFQRVNLPSKERNVKKGAAVAAGPIPSQTLRKLSACTRETCGTRRLVESNDNFIFFLVLSRCAGRGVSLPIP